MQAADDADLPKDQTFRSTINAYIVWATQVVDTYQEPGSEVPPGLPMPHWTWEGLEQTS